jgi:hypothetical protein
LTLQSKQLGCWRKGSTGATEPEFFDRRRGQPSHAQAGIANVMTVRTLAEFEEGFLRALKNNDLYFILAKVEAGAGDVPAAAFDTQENKYLFVR